MAGQTKPGDHLLVAFFKGDAYVRIEGRGTFKVSGSLKAFGLAAVEEHVARLVLDMEACVGMDSTFMGVIAGLARKFTDQQGQVLAVNLTEKTATLLQTLGLDQVVHGYLAGKTPADISLPPRGNAEVKTSENEEEGSRKDKAELMLEAHENLVELSPENYPRFKDVLTFIREDLEAAHEQESDD